MKSYIPLETQPYFFLVKLDLKQGFSSEYANIDFICMGLLDLWWARAENYKMKNSCQELDSNPGPFAYEANALSVELLELIHIDHLNWLHFTWVCY